MLSEIEAFSILVFVSWICEWGCVFWSSVLGDGTLSQIPHIPSLLYLLNFLCACIWSVSHPRLFRLGFVRKTDFYAVNVVQNY